MMVVLTHLLTAYLATGLATAYTVAPPGTAFPGAVSDCSGWAEGPTGLTCAEMAEAVGITLTEFETWVRLSLHLHFPFMPTSKGDGRSGPNIIARIPWLMMDPLVSLQVDFGIVLRLTLSQQQRHPRPRPWQVPPVSPVPVMELAPRHPFKQA